MITLDYGQLLPGKNAKYQDDFIVTSLLAVVFHLGVLLYEGPLVSKNSSFG